MLREFVGVAPLVAALPAVPFGILPIDHAATEMHPTLPCRLLQLGARKTVDDRDPAFGVTHGTPLAF